MNKSRVLSLSKLLAVTLLMPMLLTACASNSLMMQKSYISDSYMTGFHDGRHSGLKKAGNTSATLIKDVTRFAADAQYHEGWLAGEQEGIRIQKESRVSVGVASESKPKKDADKTLPNNKTVDPALIPDMQSSKLKF